MKVQFEGSEVEASEVEVVLSTEPGAEYQLADGHILKLRVVLVGVRRLEGKADTEGNPVYQWKHQIIGKVVK